MIFNKTRCLLILLLTTILSLGCGPSEERTILSTEERSLLDSVFSTGLKEARKESDNLCVQLRDSLFQEYVDSILELRLIEVDQIIND